MRGAFLGLLLACAVQAGNNAVTYEPDMGPAWTSPTERRSQYAPREGRMKKFKEYSADLLKVRRSREGGARHRQQPGATVQLVCARPRHVAHTYSFLFLPVPLSYISSVIFPSCQAYRNPVSCPYLYKKLAAKKFDPPPTQHLSTKTPYAPAADYQDFADFKDQYGLEEECEMVHVNHVGRCVRRCRTFSPPSRTHIHNLPLSPPSPPP